MILILNKKYGVCVAKLIVFSMTCLLSLSIWAARVDVAIEGMSCGMCEGKVTEELTKTGKCNKVKVDVTAKKATFETVKGKDISDDDIKEAVQKAGYTATKITRS